MFKVALLSTDKVFARRLEEYWNRQCGNEIKLENITEYSDNEYDLIVCDGNQTIDYNQKYVTLVSDNKQINEPWVLAKYGKPQDLYEKLVAICKDKSFEPKRMESLEVIKIGKENFLKYTLNRDRVDNYSLEILRKCPINGLISLCSEENDELLYYIHGKETLREFISKRREDKLKIQILKDIIDTISNLDEYMLDKNSVILDMDYIYVNIITGKAFLIYLPETNKDKNWIKEYQKILTVMSECENNNINTNQEKNKEEAFVVNKTLNYNGRTEYFPSMQRTVENNSSSLKTVKAKLYWKRNKKEIEIDRKIFKIGKENKYVDFCIFDNPAVSRNHADLILQGGDAYIIDKNSLNHTYVNGKQLLSNIKTKLNNQDEIRIANEEFVFLV